MDIFWIAIAVVFILFCAFIAFAYRIRQPDALVLYEKNGKIHFREGLIYPRHLSLLFRLTTCPIQINIDATADGNLGVKVKLVGSVAPSLDNIQALIRIGGWNSDALTRAAEEAQVLLEGMVKEYTEQSEIHTLSSTNILKHLYEQSSLIEEKLGIELVSLVVQSLEPTDPEIADALRQREKARLLEETEHLNQKARFLAAQARYHADEEIAVLNHSLELKKVDMKKSLLEKEAALAHDRLEEELERNRMRLAFEKEEVEVLKSSPELLMLTPQAARLAEASQNLKNARTVISFTPQELAQGSELINLLQRFLQKTIDSNQES